MIKRKQKLTNQGNTVPEFKCTTTQLHKLLILFKK